MPSVEALEVASPYSGEIVGRVPKGGADEARAAVDAAANALREPLPAHERARILDRAAHLLEERHDEAARLISSEAGKPMKAARVEAQRAVSTFTFAAVEARKLAGEMVPMDAAVGHLVGAVGRHLVDQHAAVIERVEGLHRVAEVLGVDGRL